LDKERIRSRLSVLAHYLENIRKIVPKDYAAYKRSAPEIKAAVERYLQVISEIELDIIVLIYKSLELKPAGGEESIINAVEDTLGRKLTDKIRVRRNLRNALVHAYSDIEGKEVFALAGNLNDVLEFEKLVRQLLT